VAAPGDAPDVGSTDGEASNGSRDAALDASIDAALDGGAYDLPDPS
jgi:hypothetical protein